MIEPKYGDGPEVILGGGRRIFGFRKTLTQSIHSKEANVYTRPILLSSGLRKIKRRYVWNAAQFREIVREDVSDLRIMGLFEPSHMQFEADRANDKEGAIPFRNDSICSGSGKKSDRPYFLSIEAGRIDHGHHAGNAYRALEDTVALSDAGTVGCRQC